MEKRSGGFMTHIPDNLSKLSKCIDFDNLSGANYALSVIGERLHHFGKIHHGSVSNIISISDMDIYSTPLGEKEAFAHIVNEFITLSKIKTLSDPLSKNIYGKMTIITDLKSVALKQEIKNVAFHKHVDGVNGLIDAIAMREATPIAIAQIASAYVENIYESIGNHIITLMESKKIPTIHDRFIYAPIMKPLGASERKLYDAARDAVESIGFDFLSRNDHGQCIERLKSAS